MSTPQQVNWSSIQYSGTSSFRGWIRQLKFLFKNASIHSPTPSEYITALYLSLSPSAKNIADENELMGEIFDTTKRGSTTTDLALLLGFFARKFPRGKGKEEVKEDYEWAIEQILEGCLEDDEEVVEVMISTWRPPLASEGETVYTTDSGSLSYSSSINEQSSPDYSPIPPTPNYYPTPTSPDETSASRF